MKGMIEKTEAVTRPITGFLKSSLFIPLLFIAQIYILITGERLFHISTTSTIAYIILPWGLLGIFYITGHVDYTGIRKVLRVKNPLSEFLSGGKYGLSQESIVMQSLLVVTGFLITYFILLFTYITFNWPIPGDMMQSNALQLIIYNLILVSPSETIAFLIILPLALSRARIKDQKIKKIYRYGISQGMFSLFHIGAYWGMDGFIGALIVSFVFGIVFLSITDKYGPSVAGGCHIGWNLWVLGAIAGTYIGV